MAARPVLAREAVEGGGDAQVAVPALALELMPASQEVGDDAGAGVGVHGAHDRVRQAKA